MFRKKNDVIEFGQDDKDNNLRNDRVKINSNDVENIEYSSSNNVKHESNISQEAKAPSNQTNANNHQYQNNNRSRYRQSKSSSVWTGRLIIRLIIFVIAMLYYMFRD